MFRIPIRLQAVIAILFTGGACSHVSSWRKQRPRLRAWQFNPIDMELFNDRRAVSVARHAGDLVFPSMGGL